MSERLSAVEANARDLRTATGCTGCLMFAGLAMVLVCGGVALLAVVSTAASQ